VTDPQTLKRLAAEHAVGFVQSGMALGLGTGSTAIFATRAIAAKLKSGELTCITAIATSNPVHDEAMALGIPMMGDEMPRSLDLTIDGADEIDPALNVIKGGGGALSREKIAAQASARVIIVADDSKLSPALGTNFALPVEVLEYGWQSQARFIAALGAEVVLRCKADGGMARTDQNNLLLDCRFGVIADATALAARLDGRAGIVAHGLFLGLATDVIVASADGIQHLQRG
jgi:ribose 5-phosphate isomerase A